MLCGIKVPLAGWDGIPGLIDVCEYTLAERSVRTGCGGRSWLVTYQGAFVMIRRSFDWYRYIIDILDLLAQPQSAMP